jgi:hypothetical protein
MKRETVAALRAFQTDIKELRKQVRSAGARVSNKKVRQFAEDLATRWVEELRSSLEHKFALPPETISEVSDQVKRLHILSRPNNRSASYIKLLDGLLDRFEDRLVLPVQLTKGRTSEGFTLQDVVPGLSDVAQCEYLTEAIAAANAGFHRAAIVLGWCAAVDRMQQTVIRIGFDTFNNATTTLRNQTSGKFKRWNKQFNVATVSELQTVFDSDLIVVLEGMGLLDGNQAERLETCFQYRNHSAHPGLAPIARPHVVAFFSDLGEIVLTSSRFK